MSTYLKLQRGQHGKVSDKWEFNSVTGQHGPGVYCFLFGNKAMTKYYTQAGENLHSFRVPKKYVKSLTKKPWSFWEARTYMSNNPQYKAFVFRHNGPGIPTAYEVVITDQSIIELLS